MSDLDGWPIMLNSYVPRPGGVVIDRTADLGGRAIVMHPDEEPHFIAEMTGEFTLAFEILNRNIRRKIDVSVARANKGIDDLMERQESRRTVDRLLRGLGRG